MIFIFNLVLAKYTSSFFFFCFFFFFFFFSVFFFSFFVGQSLYLYILLFIGSTPSRSCVSATLKQYISITEMLERDREGGRVGETGERERERERGRESRERETGWEGVRDGREKRETGEGAERERQRGWFWLTCLDRPRDTTARG